MTELKDIFSFIEENQSDLETLKRIKNRCHEYIKANKNDEKKLVSKSIDPEALEIAEYIWEEVKTRYNFAEERDTTEWAKDVRYVHNHYNITYEQLMQVVKWTQEHDFWKMNVRSGKGLKRNFERILVDFKSHYDRQEMIVA